MPEVDLEKEAGDIAGFLVSVYGGLPVWALPIFLLAIVIIIASAVNFIALGVRAQRQFTLQKSARRGKHRRGDVAEALSEDDFLWVFMVPALNEEITIADSVGRLAEVEVANKVILVINDGSDDATGAVLAALEVPELIVLERTAPHARVGKSEALNDAWRHLHETVLRGENGRCAWAPDRVIVTIVDADGRLDRNAGHLAHHFSDARVGGVQSLVSIYNRDSFLTRSQDLEFAVFGMVFQLGRMSYGTANMGGNGQFNRLSALDSVVSPDATGRPGPWRAGRLTEDQDIGLRLIAAGWRGTQSMTVSIHQQGLHSLSRLYQQRTRWAQGAWQVLDLLAPVLRNKQVGIGARLDQMWYLLTPIVQAWVGLSLVLSIVFLATGTVRPEWSVTVIVLFYGFSALPGIVGVLLARRPSRPSDVLIAIVIAHAYLLYSWIIYPVVYRSFFRQVGGRKTWVKTSRESIDRAAV